MARYEITNRAARDIEDIWDYTVTQWSIGQAEKYTDGLFWCFESIADGMIPGKSIDQVRAGYKRVAYGKHIIYFRRKSDGIAEIIRVLHSGMDLGNRLLDE